MNKKRLLVGMCSWNNPNLLKKCIGSLIDNLDFNLDGIAVVLNEGDLESINYLRSLNISFVFHPTNQGVLAIDFLKPFVQHFEYFMNTNDDMFFSKGFSDDIISIIEKYYPATASCKLVQNFGNGDPCVIVDRSINSIYDVTRDSFEAKCNIYRKLNLKKIVSYYHPICCKSEDFLKIGGYSSNWKSGYESGYARDDAFPAELRKLNKNYNFIQSGNSFVFHQSSETMKKLPPHLKNSDNQNSFYSDYGYSINDFKNQIRCYSSIE